MNAKFWVVAGVAAVYAVCLFGFKREPTITIFSESNGTQYEQLYTEHEIRVMMPDPRGDVRDAVLNQVSLQNQLADHSIRPIPRVFRVQYCFDRDVYCGNWPLTT